MKNFQFQNLTKEVRANMTAEIKSDMKNDILSITSDLTNEGKEAYPKLILAAAKDGNEVTLAESLDNLFKIRETSGDFKKVRADAPRRFAQEEFNRFYMRAVCMEAQVKEIKEVEIYEGKEARKSAKRTKALVGQKIKAVDLLKDLRENIDTKPKLFTSIGSGLSIKI